MDNEFEGNADVADMAEKPGNVSDAGDIDEDLDFGNPGAAKNNEEQELLQ
jgi:hypothetical protein